MKVFFYRNLSFLLVLPVVIALLSWLNLEIVVKPQYYSNRPLLTGKNTLIIGDSHAQTAFDDELIPNCFNAAQSSEILPQTYFKLKYLLDYETPINVVILTLGVHNISHVVDSLIPDISTYYPIMENEINESDINFQNYLYLPRGKENFKRNLKYVVSPKFIDNFKTKLYRKIAWKVGFENVKQNYFSSYVSSFNHKLSAKYYYQLPIFSGTYRGCGHKLEKMTTNEILSRHYPFKDHLISELQIRYFFKILGLCKKKNVRLFVVNTPLHADYRDHIPTVIINRYNRMMEDAGKQYSFTFINDSDLELNDSLFGDADHLNCKGMKVYSKYFRNELLKNKVSDP